MPIDHRARALDLLNQSASTPDPDRAQAIATRALTHATLAGLLEPVERPAVAVHDGGSGFYALVGVLAGHLTGHLTEAWGIHDDDAVVTELAEFLWKSGYRQTWQDAAPQAVSP